MSAVSALALTLAFTLQGLYFVQVAGFTPLQLLLIGGALELAAFLLEVPTGVVADVYSRRRSVILGFVFLGLGMLLVASVPVFTVVLVAQVVSAAGYTFLSGAQQAWLADEVGEGRAASLFVLGSQYGRVGSVVGLGLVALLALWGVQVPMLVAGGVMLALGAYLSWQMPEDGFQPVPPEQRQSWRALTATLRHGVREVRASRVLTLLMAAALLYGASTEALDRLKDYLLIREVTLPVGVSAATVFTGLALVSHLIGYGVTEPLRRRLDPSHLPHVSRAVSVMLLLSTVLLLAFAYAPNFWWAATALVLHGVALSLYSPLYSAWVNQGLDPRSRATVNSLASQADALGQVSFGPVFGLIGQLSGVRVALALAALVRLPTLPILWRAGQEEARRPEA